VRRTTLPNVPTSITTRILIKLVGIHPRPLRTRISADTFLNQSDQILNDFYAQVRCGLFHSGMTQNKVIISRDYEQVIDFTEDNTIKINPKLFLRAIRIDFNRYMLLLKDPSNTNERNNFNRMFSNI